MEDTMQVKTSTNVNVSKSPEVKFSEILVMTIFSVHLWDVFKNHSTMLPDANSTGHFTALKMGKRTAVVASIDDWGTITIPATWMRFKVKKNTLVTIC